MVPSRVLAGGSPRHKLQLGASLGAGWGSAGWQGPAPAQWGCPRVVLFLGGDVLVTWDLSLGGFECPPHHPHGRNAEQRTTGEDEESRGAQHEAEQCGEAEEDGLWLRAVVQTG